MQNLGMVWLKRSALCDWSLHSALQVLAKDSCSFFNPMNSILQEPAVACRGVSDLQQQQASRLPQGFGKPLKASAPQVQLQEVMGHQPGSTTVISLAHVQAFQINQGDQSYQPQYPTLGSVQRAH